MKRRKERPVTFCQNCKQMKVEGRMLVGLGWTICECDKPKVIETKPQAEKQNEPFIPRFD